MFHSPCFCYKIGRMFQNKRILISNGVFKDFQFWRGLILEALEKGLEAVDPCVTVKNFVKKENGYFLINERKFQLDEFQEIIVIAFGKASIRMSLALAELIPVSKGIISSSIDSKKKLKELTYIKAGHPLPDAGSEEAAKEAIKLLGRTPEDSLTFFLISGGGSSLFEWAYVPLDDLKKTYQLLIQSGATIDEINCVRKHLSRVKGGRILRFTRGPVVSMIISDVVGDRLDVIASGPTAPDPTTYFDAYSVLEKYKLLKLVPESVREHISLGMKGEMEETVKKESPFWQRVFNFIIASNRHFCLKVRDFFNSRGISTIYLGSEIQGEAREVAKILGEMALDLYRGKSELKPPLIVIFGGETTVTVRGNGKGGRNQELALAMLPYLSEIRAVFVSFGTDGIDGPTDAAGAVVDSFTLKRAQEKGLDYKPFLENNDSYSFFRELGDLLITGPTGTNVADVGILAILPISS